MNFSDYFYYAEDSPTGLRYKISRFGPNGNKLVKANSIAGTFRYENGKPRNVNISLNGKHFYAHRVIWIIFHGKIPDGMIIDHIDGNAHNNRIENLRCVDYIHNSRNMKKPSTNTSGIVGVSFTSSTNSWRAFWHDGKGKQRNKNFAVNKYGFEIAKQLAIEYRNKMISNESIKYTERHGK